jgi:hypothetical protein
VGGRPRQPVSGISPIFARTSGRSLTTVGSRSRIVAANGRLTAGKDQSKGGTMKTRLLAWSCAIALAASSLALGAARSQSRGVQMTWKISTLTQTSGTSAVDHDKTSGDPFGKGTVEVVTPQSRSPLHSTFKLGTSHGTVSGKLVTTIKPVGSISGDTITLRYSGIGKFSAGTGRYAGASGSITKLTGKVKSTTTCSTPTHCVYKESGQLKLTGTVRY